MDGGPARASVSPGGGAKRGSARVCGPGQGVGRHWARWGCAGSAGDPWARGQESGPADAWPGPSGPGAAPVRRDIFKSVLMSQPAPSQPWGSVGGTPVSPLRWKTPPLHPRGRLGPPWGQTTEVSQGSLCVRRQKAFPGCQQGGNPGQGDIRLGSGSRSWLGCGSFRKEEAGSGLQGPAWERLRGVGWQRPVGVQPLAIPHSSSLSWAGLGQPLCRRVCLVAGDRSRQGSSCF